MAVDRQQVQDSLSIAAAAAAPPSLPKHCKAPSKPVEAHSVSRRLQSELVALMTKGDPGISAFPEGDNIFSWVGMIRGSAGTVYEGLSYKLAMKFRTDYLFKPPSVRTSGPLHMM